MKLRRRRSRRQMQDRTPTHRWFDVGVPTEAIHEGDLARLVCWRGMPGPEETVMLKPQSGGGYAVADVVHRASQPGAHPMVVMAKVTDVRTQRERTA